MACKKRHAYDWNLSDLSKYFGWDSSVDDGSAIALIAREIMSFATNDDGIILSCFNPKNINKISWNFHTGCVSNGGIFYMRHKVTYKHFGTYNSVKKSKLDLGLSCIPIYIPKIYSQRILWTKNNNEHGICALKVLSTKNYDSKSGNVNELNNFISRLNTNSNKKNGETIKIEDNLVKWHKMVTKEISLDKKNSKSMLRDTKKYKPQNDTFIFYHNYKQLFCFSELFGLDGIEIDVKTNKDVFCFWINLDKCYDTSEEKVSTQHKLNIVDFWRQKDRLYLLRGSIKNTNNFTNANARAAASKAARARAKSNRNRYKVSKSKSNGGYNRNASGKCQLFEIKLNKKKIGKVIDANTGKNKGNKNSKNTKNSKNSKNSKNTKSNNSNKGKDDKKINYKNGVNVLSDTINVKKLFDFTNEFININCSYYDAKRNSLLVASTSLETNNVELFLFDNKVSKGKGKGLGKAKAKGGKAKKGNKNTKGSKNKQQKSVTLSSGKNIKIPDIIDRLFSNCQCKYLFYHSLSDSFVLLIKYNYFSLEKYNNYIRAATRDKDKKEKMNKIDIDTIEKCVSGGCAIIQMNIDLNKGKLLGIKCSPAPINIDIVCYDDTRNCIIVDENKDYFIDFANIKYGDKYLNHRLHYTQGGLNDDTFSDEQKENDSKNNDNDDDDKDDENDKEQEKEKDNKNEIENEAKNENDNDNENENINDDKDKDKEKEKEMKAGSEQEESENIDTNNDGKSDVDNAVDEIKSQDSNGIDTKNVNENDDNYSNINNVNDDGKENTQNESKNEQTEQTEQNVEAKENKESKDDGDDSSPSGQAVAPLPTAPVPAAAAAPATATTTTTSTYNPSTNYISSDEWEFDYSSFDHSFMNTRAPSSDKPQDPAEYETPIPGVWKTEPKHIKERSERDCTYDWWDSDQWKDNWERNSYKKEYQFKDTRKETNFKVFRLNEIVTNWKTIL